ncbi:MAG TPA: alpha/beta hydrolase, partial [Rheinheimera sp.]
MTDESNEQSSAFTRRDFIKASISVAGVIAFAPMLLAETSNKEIAMMKTLNQFVKTKDGVEIFYKDWGDKDAQPIVFHHGWPLTSDDWDNQMMFFLDKGYRVVAHDRRGHGRSTQTYTGNEMDTYAADVAELVSYLNLKNAIHVGHSTGGGEVARYVAKAE